MSNGIIIADGYPFPSPDYQSGKQTQSTTVDKGRSIDNVFIGRRVGRDNAKTEWKWTRLPADTWQQMCSIFRKNFVVSVKYYDMALGVITRRMYVSDRSARPDGIAEDGMTWLRAADCTLNLIDTGEGE